MADQSQRTGDLMRQMREQENRQIQSEQDTIQRFDDVETTGRQFQQAIDNIDRNFLQNQNQLQSLETELQRVQTQMRNNPSTNTRQQQELLQKQTQLEIETV
eukprot:SAG31_NODE_14755_length_789_cov_0.952174_1_plen_102_part_00